jgi:4,5-dihydroxyphthalate decarboxylase
MTTATALRLNTAIANYPHFDALKNGSVKPKGAEFDFSPISGIESYRRMTRNLEFDINEMTIVNYLLAKAYGRQFTAIPIFPSRRFHHDLLYYNENTGVRVPQDIKGRKFAMRSWTVTPATQLRGLLHHEYGVDPDSTQWVINDEEHVTEYKLPPNVEHRPGADLLQAFKDGEIVACHTSIGRPGPDAPHLKPFFTDPDAAKRDYYRKLGYVWTNHVIVVKDATMAENPWLAPALFEAFKEAKAVALKTAKPIELGGVPGIEEADPLPYGLEANRQAFEALVQIAYEQHILPSIPKTEDLFVESTLDLK